MKIIPTRPRASLPWFYQTAIAGAILKSRLLKPR